MTEHQMTPQEFAAKVDAEVAAKREADRRKALGLPPVKTEWSAQDHIATAERVRVAEERKKEAAKLPDARSMTDAEFQEACRKAGINVTSALM